MNNTKSIILDQRALVLNEQGQILLVKTESGWDLAGGLYDGNGNWKESLESQLEQEFGIAVMTKQPILQLTLKILRAVSIHICQ